MKVISDTLKVGNKYSIKRVGSFTAFFVAIIYGVLVPIFMAFFGKTFTPDLTIFNAFMLYSGGSMGATVWNKRILRGENLETNKEQL